MAKQKTYNPCDDCRCGFSRNNQESGMCKICELEYFKDRLLDARTADVVPKSEVEALQAEVERLQKHNTEFARKHYEDGYNTAKTEVARKIFEEIAKIFGEHMLWYRFTENQYQSYAKLKKKYTE